MKQVEMIALRPFPRMFGQAIRRLVEGETFLADEKETSALEAAGKAKRAPEPDVKPDKPGRKGA